MGYPQWFVLALVQLTTLTKASLIVGYLIIK